jgi:hypothetical protein
MSRFKKLFVILAAVIGAGCESQAITQGKQAIALCDIYKTGPQYAEARSLVGNLGKGTPTPSQIANARYPTDAEIRVIQPYAEGITRCTSEAFELFGQDSRARSSQDYQQSVKVIRGIALLYGRLLGKSITYSEFFIAKMELVDGAQNAVNQERAAQRAAAAAASARKQQAMQEYWKKAGEAVSSWDTDLGTIDTQPYKPAQRQNQSNVVNCKRTGDMSNQVYTYQNSCPIGYFRVN